MGIGMATGKPQTIKSTLNNFNQQLAWFICTKMQIINTAASEGGKSSARRRHRENERNSCYDKVTQILFTKVFL